MIKCAILTVDINDPEGSLNQQLTTLGIAPDAFIQAVVYREEKSNSSAKIAIFYEV
jgi:hypothetical protein